MNKVITISRQFGSGGRTIGKDLARKLGIPCYDEEIINKIAAKSGLAKKYISENGEYAPYTTWFGNALAYRDSNGHSLRDELFAAQQTIILDAAKEPCVIVGRCADYILKDTADCLTVFVHASLENRAKRLVEVYGEENKGSENIQKSLIEKDKRRRAYYQFYTDMKWGDAAHYDISLDSGKFGIDTCVEIIARLYT